MKPAVSAIILSLIVMLICPWAAVRFAPGDAGMAVCFLLFFAANPLCSVGVGILSGKEGKWRWWLPVMNVLAFLMGVWIVFDWGNPDFYGYALVYLVLGWLAAAVMALAVRKK